MENLTERISLGTKLEEERKQVENAREKNGREENYVQAIDYPFDQLDFGQNKLRFLEPIDSIYMEKAVADNKRALNGPANLFRRSC